jgi:carboxymethylenebutenolidase
MTTRVSFKSRSGKDVSGELDQPAGSAKVPSVVLVQEYWGINDHIRDLTERLAKEGFLVVAPDLYHGAVTKDAGEGVSAAVPFYGVPPPEKVDYGKITAPVLMHVAKHDEWVTVGKAEAVKKALDASGTPMELHVYDAQHAFMNDTRPGIYSPENAKLAWDRTVAFLKKHLA